MGSSAVTFILCYLLSNTVAVTAIGREGRAFWLLKLAPISPWRILLGKLALAYLPYPLIGTLLLVILSLLGGSSLQSFLYGWSLLLLLGLGNASLALGLGAAFPRVKWDNPNQQTTLVAGCLSTLLPPVYSLLVASAALGPPIIIETLMPASGPLLLLLTIIAGWFVALLLTALVLWCSLAFGAWGVERMEW
jgi:ABC-2 type transport system permease protein